MMQISVLSIWDTSNIIQMNCNDLLIGIRRYLCTKFEKKMSQTKQFLQLEALWWVFTIVVLLGVLFPMLLDFKDYPFWWQNGLFVVLFITFTRYIFLLKHTFLGKAFWVKLVFLCLVVPLVFFIAQEVNLFQGYLDEKGLDPLLEHLSAEKTKSLVKYIHSEMILFGVGAIVAAVVLALRFVLSIWRQWNKGTV